MVEIFHNCASQVNGKKSKGNTLADMAPG